MSAGDQREQRAASLSERIRSQAAISSRYGQAEELEEIADEVSALEARAVRYAEALRYIHGHATPTDYCKPDKYASCEAIRWLAERAP